MTTKKRRTVIVMEAMQLRWDNWSAMCEFAAVGRFEDGHPQGIYVDDQGRETADSNGRMGLKIPGRLAVEKLASDRFLFSRAAQPIPPIIAVQDDWIVKLPAGSLFPCKPDHIDSLFPPKTGWAAAADAVRALSDTDLERALENMGIHLADCDACAEVFFTGSKMHGHSCTRGR